MSVRRLIAEIDPKHLNVTEFTREHGISRTTFYNYRKRFSADGEAGLETKSRAPLRVANKTPPGVEEQIIRLRKELDDAGLDAGAQTIHWHLQDMAELVVVPSVSTVYRVLKRHGLVEADSSKSRTSFKRFESDHANGMWQLDGTDWELADGTSVKIINLLDDGSRVLVASRVHSAESFDGAWDAYTCGVTGWGPPERLLHDNGKAFLKLGRRVELLGVVDVRSRFFHPQTCGKVERFHRTMKKWLTKKGLVATVAELQVQADEFTRIYNYERPHRGIGRKVPAARWAEMPKSGPTDRPLSTPTAISVSKVGSNGWVMGHGHRFAVGNAFSGQLVSIVLTGSNCHIFNNDGVIRHLHLEPNAKSHALYARRGRPSTRP